jgi:hypothetical protein
MTTTPIVIYTGWFTVIFAAIDLFVMFGLAVIYWCVHEEVNKGITEGFHRMFTVRHHAAGGKQSIIAAIRSNWLLIGLLLAAVGLCWRFAR